MSGQLTRSGTTAASSWISTTLLAVVATRARSAGVVNAGSRSAGGARTFSAGVGEGAGGTTVAAVASGSPAARSSSRNKQARQTSSSWPLTTCTSGRRQLASSMPMPLVMPHSSGHRRTLVTSSVAAARAANSGDASSSAAGATSTEGSMAAATTNASASSTVDPAAAAAASAAATGPELPAVAHDDAKINVGWMDGKWSRFHNRFLYDHCRCPKCMHAVTKQRLKQLVDVPADIKAIETSTDIHGLHVTWFTPDSHKSFYPWSFLHRASYDPQLVEPRPNEDRILWNSTIAKSPPTVEYASLIPSDKVTEEQAERGMLRWLSKIHDFGFCFVSGLPVSPEATEQLIRRIGNIRETHYGGFWDFTADLKHGDMAYTNEALPAHTDNTYFTDPSGLQCFHLLSHTEGKGGETLLVDAFYAASILNQLHPSAYALLSRLRIPSHASGSPGTLLRPRSQPVLKHDGVTGELIQVRWNNEDRGVLGHGWRPDEVDGWYDAALKWEESSRSADAEYWVQLAPGTMVVIDNWRVMHGRSAFTGQRRMCGAYVGNDDWKSRLATLRRRFDDKAPDPASPEAVWEVGW